MVQVSSSTGKIAGDRVSGVPASGPNRTGAQDQYEYGSAGSINNAGRYKAFATPFSAAPIVVATVRNAAGSHNVFVMRAVVGSFRVKVDRAGTTTANWIAFGAR